MIGIDGITTKTKKWPIPRESEDNQEGGTQQKHQSAAQAASAFGQGSSKSKSPQKIAGGERPLESGKKRCCEKRHTADCRRNRIIEPRATEGDDILLGEGVHRRRGKGKHAVCTENDSAKGSITQEWTSADETVEGENSGKN